MRKPVSDPEISVEVSHLNDISFAMQQNNIPLIRSVRVRNQGDAPLRDLEIRIETSPEVSVPSIWDIPQIPPGQDWILSPARIEFLGATLRAAAERHSVRLWVEVSEIGHVRVAQEIPFTILAHDEWSQTSPQPALLAAFVMPADSGTVKILEIARSLLAQSGLTSFPGYQPGARRDVLRTSAVVYRAVASRTLTHAVPPGDPLKTGQKLMTPGEVLSQARASSLDLGILMAAALEQAGLNPLVVLTGKTVLSGIWLKSDSFPDPVIRHGAELRNRIRLGELRLFELSGLCQQPAMPFESAIKHAEHLLEDESQFHLGIDIRAARIAGIRPLSLDSSVVFEEAVFEPEEAPLDLGPFEVPAAAQTALEPEKEKPVESPVQRLDRWKNRLLDLSLRNRLLNFKPTRKSVELVAPNLARFEDALMTEEDFRLLPKAEEGAPFDESLTEAFERRHLFSLLEREELESRLVGLERSARLGIQESGANTLYLSLGFLVWYESAASDKPLRAPILLVPMRLERKAIRDGFRIRKLDEDIRVNVTLLKKLLEMGLPVQGLDVLPEDHVGVDVDAVFNSFRQAVASEPRWQVEEKAVLAILTFSRFLMWLDLEKNASQLRESALVAHLIDTPNEAYPAQGEFPQADGLDDTYPSKDIFCPLDADSSQLAAVMAAAEKKSFVLQGPPGTGKSQTITNLISHSLAHGKRVLFVSEKMAALDVVHSRLAAAGLSPFCLELHSAKTTRAALREELQESFALQDQKEPAEWIQEAGKLDALRKELNRYVRALHEPRSFGQSVHWGIGQIIKHKGVKAPRITLGEPRTVDRTRFDAMKAAVRTFSMAAREAGNLKDHPLKVIEREQWHPSLPGEVTTALDQLRESAAHLEEAVKAVFARFQLDPMRATLKDIETVGKAVRLLGTSPSVPKSLLGDPDLEPAAQKLEEWIRRGRARDEERKRLYETVEEKFLDADLRTWAAKTAEVSSAWFGKKFFALKTLKKEFQPFLRPGKTASTPEEMEALIRAGLTVREETDKIAGAPEPARLFGAALWQLGEADWDRLERTLRWAVSFREATRATLDSGQQPLPQFLIAAERADQARAGSQAEREATTLSETLAAFHEQRSRAVALLGLNEKFWEGQGNLGKIRAACDQLQENLSGLFEWCRYRAEERRMKELQLSGLVDGVEDGSVDPSRLEEVFERAFCDWWVPAVMGSDPALKSYAANEHAERVEGFRTLDEKLLQLTKKSVVARLCARLPYTGGEVSKTPSTSVGKLRRFVNGGRAPIRKLFEECADALALYKPCVLMSPQSLSQFLGADFPRFDLVVFDEASQMPPWEAVGALARAKQAVIVGDSKQLPPTSFFEVQEPSEAEWDAGEIPDEESILDECVSARLPELELKWHYRSRHESLIAFSNRRYYKNLLTFPSPERISETYGVSWRPVPEGIYDAGGTRTNRKEAEAVVQEVLLRLLDPMDSKRSLGIVTFSLAQQRLIEDLLEKSRAEFEEIDAFFTRDAEPVFVKNLETVQGDERDVILFSIGYGPDQYGRVAMRFGPLNTKGGERRLNVAVTRAREQLVVFSTLEPEQIDLSKTSAAGVAHLKAFLAFAKNGDAGLSEESLSAMEGEDSPLEESIASELLRRGYTVHSQIGCSGFRIDLAVLHPSVPGQYVLGIECDGANYRSARTARERDRLREQILARLGWRLHRVWSTDWWRDPKKQADRVEAAIRSALQG